MDRLTATAARSETAPPSIDDRLDWLVRHWSHVVPTDDPKRYHAPTWVDRYALLQDLTRPLTVGNIFTGAVATIGVDAAEEIDRLMELAP